MKTCSACALEKPVDAFYRHPNSADGLDSVCKRCKLQRAYEGNLWLLYGLTAVEHARMLAAQDGRCAICRRPCKSGRRLCVDHNHATGAIRGLLCSECNMGLGKFEDRPDLLRAAEAYLSRHTNDS